MSGMFLQKQTLPRDLGSGGRHLEGGSRHEDAGIICEVGLNLRGVLVSWPEMTQVLAGSIRSAYGWETPRSCCTAACRRRRCGCPGSLPQRWEDLVRRSGKSKLNFEDFLWAAQPMWPEHCRVTPSCKLFTYGVKRCHLTQHIKSSSRLQERPRRRFGELTSADIRQHASGKIMTSSKRRHMPQYLYLCQWQSTTTTAARSTKTACYDILFDVLRHKNCDTTLSDVTRGFHDSGKIEHSHVAFRTRSRISRRF